MTEPVEPADELEPVIDQDAVKIRTLELETLDDAEDLLYIAAVVDELRCDGVS